MLGRGILCGQAGSQLAIVMPAKLRGAKAFPICRCAHFAEHLIKSILQTASRRRPSLDTQQCRGPGPWTGETVERSRPAGG
ncbi:hypothetical protein BSU04_32550 [Caballeronia sordidicola]|uniref:Uncharacterized protein n=1 Tax=Caballeronia sordidicola TaxID=196367 RepID=A0A226WU41_CABSO|nr:hypothetical protein BSU04_32550 [Caballeronia sordidicola]